MSLIPLTMACVIAAANMQQIPTQAIMTILSIEGGRVGQVSSNTNGSSDLGPMQINDHVWIPVIADLHFNGNEDKAYRMVRDHGCYNVFVGSWILRQAIDDADGDTMKGIGWYHSRTPKHTKRYQNLFIEKFNKLFN